jgi:hypothetical protein
LIKMENKPISEGGSNPPRYTSSPQDRGGRHQMMDL